MQFKRVLISIITVYSCGINQTWASSCPEDIQVIEKEQVANCSGLLFSPEASKKADEAVDDRDYYKSLSDKYKLRSDLYSKEVDVLEQRVTLYQNQSQDLAKELTDRETTSSLTKIIYFTLGVVVTGISVHEAARLTN